ncbi:uncharacterized protein LOC119574962 [Penaeus monodon]|uniref:uncharacterized protein LOC119574962 n=1 Tax=Penaeus monodon TaxID=6687 RepID=UPI0018A73DB4|nr:uncharacterized protein LOC119574962 [Penaeus monodon]
MGDMEKLQKKRAVARGWATRKSNTLKGLLNNPDVSVIDLQAAMDDFDQRLASLEEVQTLLELETDFANLDEELDNASEFFQEVRKPRLQAAQRLGDLMKGEKSESISSSSPSKISSSNKMTNVKLPKLELPKFKGDVTLWQSFWDQFKTHVHDSDIPVIAKFSYLQSLLEGDAKGVVKGLAHTEANYQIACDMLKERFGRHEHIKFAHVQALLNYKSSVKGKGPKYVSSLWNLRDELLTHIRSLEALGVSGEQCEVFLTPIILACLPEELRMEWAREGSGHESDLSWLLHFLQREIERIERSETFSVVLGKAEGRFVESEKRRVPSASALYTSSEAGSYFCAFCSKKHKSEKCWDIQKLSFKEREERIKAARLCFKCLSKGHIASGCRIKCSKCNGNHNSLLCRAKGNINSNKAMEKDISDQKISDTAESSSENCSPEVNHVGVALSKCNVLTKTSCVLQTARVKVYGDSGICCEATLLFDTGSDRSYVSSNFVKKVKPKWVSSETVSYAAFGGSKSHPGKQSNIFDLKLVGLQGVKHLMALEIPKVCAPLTRPCIPSKFVDAFSDFQLADDYKNNNHLSIDILVGLDAYWGLMDPEIKPYQKNGLVAQRSVFGWVLSGSWMNSTNKPLESTQMLCIGNVTDSDLREFWSLESVGITQKETVTCPFTSDPVLQQFCGNVKFDGGRYEVGLPWKSDDCKKNLRNNEGLARKRLEGLERKLDKDPQLKEQYFDVFTGYEDEGIIEEVPSNEIVSSQPIYYMPHRPVVKESSTSTKIRPVFDASAASYNGVSLNDCLESGPSLNPDLVKVLIRFRRWKVALTADITKAFLQICVQQKDRDVHRFLWKCKDSIRIMRFVRVPFGNTCSPFLLNATIKYHLQSFPNTEVIEELKENLYVDDWLSGADSAEEASDKFKEAQRILALAGFPLSKWRSNCRLLTTKFNDKIDHGKEHVSTKVLGMMWLSLTDQFVFGDFDLDTETQLVSTKRAVLSLIAKLFDPLGLISPFVMYAKILFQDIWRLGLDWDEVLPKELQNKFQNWVKSIAALKYWKINRCYFPEISWSKLSGLELHAFGDASEKGYGASVYLRVPLGGGTYQVSFVVARSRVAPIKRVTLPRLELLGALLCARLLDFVKSALYLDKTVTYCCWTDSKVALAWIKGNPCRWKAFVSNRVVEIQSLTSPCHWYHCSGKENPADLISRGELAEPLVNSTLWINGPTWLSEPLTLSDKGETVDLPVEESYSEKIISCVSVTTPNIFEFERWSHFNKAHHIVGWVMRFINNARPHSVKMSGPLSSGELVKAKTKLFYCVQREKFAQEIADLRKGKSPARSSPLCRLDPFVDDEGLLRIKGRLENADLSFESKHPIIVPSGHVAKLLVQFQHIFLKHAGVSTIVSTLRGSYWIMGVRRIAKTVCRVCVRCKRYDSRACNQPAAPLPGLRVKTAPPFTVTGLDYAGPLFCIDLPSKKLYILLFTCAVIRAVHLELTDSLSLSDCMLALRRFAARRGIPSVFYSDNAKTFVGAARQLQQEYGPLSPQWKFIVPRSPWWGGWWERLIRSVKSALRKTIGVRCLSRIELETTLHEVEVCVNSRPLTFVGDEPDVSNPLTPSHFLIGRNAGFQLDISDQPSYVTRQDLIIRESVRQQQLDKFWKLWSNDYLRNLPPVVKGFVQNCNVQKGAVVLVREDHVPRLKWPLGVVTEVFPGNDNIIRSVRVKTDKGTVNRPVQKLHDLEMYSPLYEDSEEKVTPSVPGTSENSASEPCEENILKPTSYSRRGRAVRTPVKLDL